MYWILFVMGFIAAVVIALVVGGLATPREHVVSRTTTLRAQPDRVRQLIRDVAAYDKWRDDLIEVEIVDPHEPGLRWREISTGGSVLFGMTEDEPPTRFAAEVLDEDIPWGGAWTWELEPSDEGTRLTITERGFVGNPIFRFIGTHFIGFTGSIDKFINAVARQLGEAKPRIK